MNRQCQCTCQPYLDYDTQRMLTEAFWNAMVTQYWVFTKSIWVDDIGFMFEERNLEIPKRYCDTKEKLHYFKTGLQYIDEGFECNYFSTNRGKIEEAIVDIEGK